MPRWCNARLGSRNSRLSVRFLISSETPLNSCDRRTHMTERHISQSDQVLLRSSAVSLSENQINCVCTDTQKMAENTYVKRDGSGCFSTSKTPKNIEGVRGPVNKNRRLTVGVLAHWGLHPGIYVFQRCRIVIIINKTLV